MEVTAVHLREGDLFVDFEGGDLAEGSDLHVFIVTVGEGCSTMPGVENDIYLRPDADNPIYAMQYQSDSPACGLSITALPEVDGRAAGRFEGSLDRLNSGDGPAQVLVNLTFDVPSAGGRTGG